jgi:hypothetical protein
MISRQSKRMEGLGMDKHSARVNIDPPVRIKDLKATIVTAHWFSLYSQEMAAATKRAVEAGMPEQLALQVYKDTVQRVMPDAVIVRSP